MKVLLCGYRSWSIKLFNILKNTANYQFVEFDIVYSKKEFYSFLDKKYDLVFFVGWSYIVKKSFLEQNICIAVHPSMLPKFRGGSPIQNQIINGIYASGITLFLMNGVIDSGNILRQTNLSLKGDLYLIFKRIIKLTVPLILSVIDEFHINKSIIGIEQDESKACYFNRRTPEMSEITIRELTTSNAQKIHDKIRSLQYPYPNAYIQFNDGSILYITKSKLLKR